jgi:6,7-dimethyl-8-ribityllumazine synthase
MSTTRISDFNPAEVPSALHLRFGIVVSEWNGDITGILSDGAYNTLMKYGALPENITTLHVPGSFELPTGARMLAETGKYDVLILLGCVIRGETSHYDYVCQGVTQGTMTLNLQYDLPFIFGVLTTENRQQALDRAGGKYGNKGDEAAITAIKMATLLNKAKK